MLIEYKLPNILMNQVKGVDVMWVTGVNAVTQEHWNEISKAPSIQRLMAESQIVVLSKTAAEDLKQLSIPKAVETVGKVYDVKLLTEWQKSEKREAIVDALKTQLSVIKKPDEPKVESKEG